MTKIVSIPRQVPIRDMVALCNESGIDASLRGAVVKVLRAVDIEYVADLVSEASARVTSSGGAPTTSDAGQRR